MDENLNLEGNTEIEKALKEFEVKSQAEQIKKAPESLKTSDVPKMVQLVMKWSGGVIKEQKQAEYVLLGFVVVAIGISLFLFFNPLSGGNYPKLDSTALNKLMQTPPAEIPPINK